MPLYLPSLFNTYTSRPHTLLYHIQCDYIFYQHDFYMIAEQTEMWHLSQLKTHHLVHIFMH